MFSVFPAILSAPQGQGGFEFTFVHLGPDTWWYPAEVNGCLGFGGSLDEWERRRPGRQTDRAFLLKRNEGPGRALETVCAVAQGPD